MQNGKLLSQRQELPIFPLKRRLAAEIRRHDSVIIIGETGSGKTTQLPQFLHEFNLTKGRLLACTQPRRVAAITVATRVAQEMGCQVGETVGYSVRFEDATSPSTKIKYMTDGMLLREAILDPMLKKYSIVILDEAHERTLHTDVLFGVVKGAQKKRQNQGGLPLKLVIMSATMDVDQFSKYFNSAPVYYVEGRQFPIKVKHVSQSQSDYLFAALVTVFQIHRQEPAGQDILLFLTGQDEIESAVRQMKQVVRELGNDYPPLLICPMYAALPPAQQLRVFQPTPKGSRKVIVATNIAETSVTIRGIKFVIDSGMVKAKIFNSRNGLDLLKVQRISKAQVWQRTGRAGREAPGTCLRMFTDEEFESMSENTVPEILRCNLAGVILQLLAMGVTDVLNFDFMDKPSTEAIISAMELLHLLDAVVKEDSIHLTTIGRKMAAFPLDPRLAKVIIAAKDFRCLEEILTVVSMLSVESVLHTPQNKKDEATAARLKFVSSEGDHMTLLNMYRAYKGVSGNKQWCHENYINSRNMRLVTDIRQQLREICVRMELPLQSCGQDMSAIRKCFTQGFFMNAAEFSKEKDFITVTGRKTVAIHPSSALFMSKPACVIYNELVQTTKCYMRDLCVVDPDWLYEAAPAYFKRKKTGPNT